MTVYCSLSLCKLNSPPFYSHPERPERISTIKARFRDYNLIERLHRLPTRAATTDELCTTHTRLHVSRMRKTCEPANDLQAAGDEYNSVYLHPKTFECAAVAVGSVLQVVDHVVRGKSRSGVCVVRPPGHHAEADGPQGFCIFNNVAVAAQYAVRDHGLKRVLILDWDVHHGNGTQHMFAESSEVLYVSVHRYDHGAFFPKSVDADFGVVGSGEGEGFNVNIPWNKVNYFHYLFHFIYVCIQMCICLGVNMCVCLSVKKCEGCK